jgi:hypothetical protein
MGQPARAHLRRRFLPCRRVQRGGPGGPGYPGCAEPGPIGKVWYVDPVNGKTPADGSAGTQKAPWNSLQGVVSSTKQPGYPYPMLSTIPYDHYSKINAEGKRVYADGPSNDSTRVQPGDEILLMGGQYGDVAIGRYGVATTNPAFVTIAAAPGQTPVLASLAMSATSMWRFQHLSVQSLGTNRAINIIDQARVSPSFTTSDLIFESMVVGSPEDVDRWTQAQWIANAHWVGFSAVSSPDGLNTKCVSFTGGTIHGNRTGVALFAHNSLFSNNEIDRFSDDGVGYAANNLIISDNYVHDNEHLGDGAHPDCMQGYLGPLNKATAPKTPKGVSYPAYSNVTIERNRCIRQTDPNLEFPFELQGIDAFDSDWTNLTVVNNLVVTSACWGIAYASVHGGKIINNTVLDDGSNVGEKNAAGNVVCRPAIGVGDTSHEGLSSNDVTVRNNFANQYRMAKVSPTVTLDHNICLTIEGGCQIAAEMNGATRFLYKPGEYGDHNIIDRRGAAGMFVGFDPAKFVFDLRLKPDALAIGAGNPADAPAVDITGAPRRAPIDIGAYQYRPDK